MSSNSDSGISTRYYVYDLFALTKRGVRYKLLRTYQSESAFRVEEIIEDFLDIEDVEVHKFASPRLQLGFQSLLMIGIGLVILPMSFATASSNLVGGFLTFLMAIVFIAAGGRLLSKSAFDDRESVEDELQS